MIIGYHGTPGSGKTYEAVKKILDNLCRGRIVFTNIDGFSEPDCKEAIKSLYGLSDLALERQLKVFENGQTEEFWMHVPPGALIVIDEVQNFFNSRDWQSQANRDFSSWASIHRKKGFDCILISQRPERIDSAVRSLFQWCYVFRKIDFFGSLVTQKYLMQSYAGEDTSGEPLSKKTLSYDPRIFLCYKSYVTSDAVELEIQKHTNILKHPVIYAIPIVLCLTVYLFSQSSFFSGDLFGSKASIDHITETTKPTEPVSSVGFNVTQQSDGVSKFSNRSNNI